MELDAGRWAPEKRSWATLRQDSRERNLCRTWSLRAVDCLPRCEMSDVRVVSDVNVVNVVRRGVCICVHYTNARAPAHTHT